MVLIGAPGTGKTFWALSQFENVYRVLDPVKGWFDGLDGQKVALLDDVGRGSLPHHNYLKQLLDCYGLTVQVKGGSVEWSPELVILTSNELITEWYGPDVSGIHYDALLRRVKVFYLPTGIEELNRWAEAEVPHLLKREEAKSGAAEQGPEKAQEPSSQDAVSETGSWVVPVVGRDLQEPVTPWESQVGTEL